MMPPASRYRKTGETRITPAPARGETEDRMWLRRGITANLRRHARPDAGLDVAFIRTSLGRDAAEVRSELCRMRDDHLVVCYEAGDGRNRTTRWYLTDPGARR
jgi:hypothetical protein